ncbi:MAG: enoyl-CoA hydratase/isomerase family protein [Chthoniobacterales bacterium]|nr:enoyl-CoA hydratase/isomerase family protein [Chthoniobacterales bacterium]
MSVVLTEQSSAHITIITLNRPERRNALTIELMSKLIAAVDAASADDAQRVLILRGAGAGFCSGMDLNETADPTKAHESGGMVAKTLLALSQARLVTIAAVHGAAVAGGAGIMSACDFVIAAEGTKIGYPEVKRGLVAGLVMTFLRRQLRERDIRELLLGAELIDVARAREIGLVNRIVPADQLEGEVQKLATSLLQGAPGALANSKRLLEQLWSSPVKEDIEKALSHHMQARESLEAKEGVAAFLEKRKPHWAE